MDIVDQIVVKSKDLLDQNRPMARIWLTQTEAGVWSVNQNLALVGQPNLALVGQPNPWLWLTKFKTLVDQKAQASDRLKLGFGRPKPMLWSSKKSKLLFDQMGLGSLVYQEEQGLWSIRAGFG
ncbi:hypothetical protein AXF42_Ash021403 [Apostasia shenzhenica]|uniref:Uncharacterized protein n=1 Tax=Apostasia shenzhenica TaxID=1088818 RepID=A0A2H9ZZI6_9ASPA|nr:hypothetical protein AXF42_Ash021403 [Apostasia shenzhenica]